jgi:aspartate/methionine/tyrosine aminotransferase
MQYLLTSDELNQTARALSEREIEERVENAKARIVMVFSDWIYSGNIQVRPEQLCELRSLLNTAAGQKEAFREIKQN